MSQIQIVDEHGRGPAGIVLRISEGDKPSEDAIFDFKTNSDGTQTWPIPNWPKGRYTIWINTGPEASPSYTSSKIDVLPQNYGFDQHGSIMRTGASSDVGGFIRAGGPDRCPYFIDEDGKPWLLAGYSMHLALPFMKNGGDISPIIEEAKRYGYNTGITIGSHLSQWKLDNGFYFDPLASDANGWLERLLDAGAEQAFRFAHAVLADQQGRTLDQQRRSIAAQGSVMRGRWNVFARKGNESNVNGWDPFALDFGDLGGVLQSQGSSGEGNVPHTPYLHFSEWESRRQPFHKSMDDSGAGILEQNEGYGSYPPWKCPIVMIEGKYFHDNPTDKWGDHRDTDPALALQQGLEIGANCAGGGFGASDGLECLPLGPTAAECARQQARGMRASFLR